MPEAANPKEGAGREKLQLALVPASAYAEACLALADIEDVLGPGWGAPAPRRCGRAIGHMLAFREGAAPMVGRAGRLGHAIAELAAALESEAGGPEAGGPGAPYLEELAALSAQSRLLSEQHAGRTPKHFYRGETSASGIGILSGRHEPEMERFPGLALAQLALAMWDGALKYGLANFREASVHLFTYCSAFDRHLQAYLSGQRCDPVSGVHHLGHAMACCAILIDAMAAGRFVDDRPGPGGYLPWAGRPPWQDASGRRVPPSGGRPIWVRAAGGEVVLYAGGGGGSRYLGAEGEEWRPLTEGEAEAWERGGRCRLPGREF